MNIIDGSEIARKIRNDIKDEIDRENFKITLGIILIGNDKASKIYIKYKIKNASEVGIKTELHELDENITREKVLDLINKLNDRKEITGFFIQAPIPHHLDLNELTSHININKDVDGMTSHNLGNLYQGKSPLISATPLAVMELLKVINLVGKDIVIINRSSIIGKPLAALLLNENATVQICHSKTKGIFEKTKLADVIILGTGKESFLKSENIKSGAIIIDCGAPLPEADKSVYEIDGYISPVPGGVGPLTIACLLRNCLIAYKL